MDIAGSRKSHRRRQLLGAFGWTIAASVTSRTFARAVVAPPASVSEANTLVLSPGHLGPQLIAAGVIDPGRFISASKGAGEPLAEIHKQILLTGIDRKVTLDASSDLFLLNFFWAVGLANGNRVLTRGPMMRSGLSRITGYASTGGWTLATRPVVNLYASLPLIAVTDAQQERVMEVASTVYRPCCDNPTSFPDCNHGMAMLGLLTLLAAEGREVKSLFAAAKTANGFWFPDAAMKLAAYVKATRGIEYADLDGREASGRELFSVSGHRKVIAWASPRSITAPSAGSSC